MTATYVDSTGVMPNCRISFTSGNTSSNEVHRRMASLHLVKLDAVMREDSSSSSESIRFSFKNVSNTASLSLLLSCCSIRGTSIFSPFVVLSLTEDVFNTSLVPSFNSNRVPPKLPPSSFSSRSLLSSSSSSMLPINTALTFLDFFTSLLLIFVSRAAFAIFDDFGRLCLFCRSSRAAFLLLFPAPLP